MRLSLMARVIAAGVAAILTLTACGGGSGAGTSASRGKLEKTDVTVGVIPIVDAAPIQIAINRGFFKEEGLTVKPQTIQGASIALPSLDTGALDVMLLNYITAFTLEDKTPGKYKIIADSYQSAPNTFLLMVSADSEMMRPEDLKGKTIAVNALNAIAELAVTTALATVGVDPERDRIKFVEVPFPNMPQALRTKQADAIWVVEPFISSAQKDLGARKLIDTMSGPTANFPIAGWGTTSEWVKKYPNTLAAFQRALGRAQQVAALDRKAVEEVLPTYARIPRDVAAIITLGEFPTSLNETRLQRVPDTMLEVGYLKNKINARALVVPPAGS